MSISPPSDIVFDVARAADPQAYRAAAEKLAQASGAESASTDFASAVAAAAPPAAAAISAPPAEPTTLQSAQVSAKKKANAYSQFEAFFLQTFVESMLPKDGQAIFGSGVAGNIWKSMLSEHLANELAQSAAFGIAKKLAENRAVKDKAADDALKRAQPSAVTEPAGKDPTSGYVTSLQKLLAADGKQAVSQAPAADALALITKG